MARSRDDHLCGRVSVSLPQAETAGGRVCAFWGEAPTLSGLGGRTAVDVGRPAITAPPLSSTDATGFNFCGTLAQTDWEMHHCPGRI